jgi:hypothetical protein
VTRRSEGELQEERRTSARVARGIGAAVAASAQRPRFRPERISEDVMNEQRPLPIGAAVQEVIRCVVTTVVLLARRRIHLPRRNVGQRLRFPDGTSSRVYRETVVERPVPADPCVLVVEFRLRAVRGRAHVLFRWESILNTPLFVGFPGFVSKFWMAADQHGVYRGLYEWDGPARAEAYARALWRVLALVSVRGSIHYRVLPGLRREEFLVDAVLTGEGRPAQVPGEWWRPVAVA